ncbi:receptor-like protein EIX1 [Mangifera indica]|uniref:receptor-like protein EIX1 n=1 Tax=Mangifera indica TaxID=29780 RepID=UPI001CF99905|nr:receptor-like protein EIX1 [Mangifera indica]
MSVLTAPFFLAISIINHGFCNGSTHMDCIESERQALLRFKQDLIDSSNRQPLGLLPMDIVAHGLGTIGGKINLALLDLKRLIFLDSSDNYFGVQIPNFLGSMKNLRYLDLSGSKYVGMVPPQLGNLSNLHHLNLGGNPLIAENLNWVSSLSSLQHLDFSALDIQKPSDTFPIINTLPSLRVLRLSSCGLTHLPDSLPNLNFSSLVNLDLSANFFNNSLIPGWIFSLNDFVVFNLRATSLSGPISDGLQNLLH